MGAPVLPPPPPPPLPPPPDVVAPPRALRGSFLHRACAEFASGCSWGLEHTLLGGPPCIAAAACMHACKVDGGPYCRQLPLTLASWRGVARCTCCPPCPPSACSLTRPLEHSRRPQQRPGRQRHQRHQRQRGRRHQRAASRRSLTRPGPRGGCERERHRRRICWRSKPLHCHARYCCHHPWRGSNRADTHRHRPSAVPFRARLLLPLARRGAAD